MRRAIPSGVLRRGEVFPSHPRPLRLRKVSTARVILGYLTRYRPIETRVQKIVVTIMFAVLAVVYSITWGIPAVDLYPVWGRSLQPTAKIFSLPEPFAFLSFSGWVHCSKVTPEPGNIVYFKVPNSRDKEVKRVVKKELVSGVARYWLQPDSDVSGEGSGFGRYGWVYESHVMGVVDQIWTPTRFFRSLARRGKFQNWVEVNASALSLSKGLLWRGDGEAVAVLRGSMLSIYRADASGKGKKVYEDSCRPSHYEVPAWIGNGFAFPKGNFNYGYWQENCQLKTIVIKPLPPKQVEAAYGAADLQSGKTNANRLDWKVWLAQHHGKVLVKQPAGLKPLAIFDGDPLTSWGPFPEDPNRHPAEVVIDLGVAPNIVGAALYGLNSGDSFRVELLSSQDGKSWTKVIDRLTEVDAPSLSMEAPATSSRFWKLRIHTLQSLMTGTIGEFQLITFSK